MYSQKIEGRIPKTGKWNPIWWFKNVDDPVPPAGSNALTWWLRNPFHNFMFYVIGIADQNYTIYSTCEPAFDGPPMGWKFHYLLKTIPLPFISYVGNHLVFYLGWRHFGAFGMKLNWRI